MLCAVCEVGRPQRRLVTPSLVQCLPRLVPCRRHPSAHLPCVPADKAQAPSLRPRHLRQHVSSAAHPHALAHLPHAYSLAHRACEHLCACSLAQRPIDSMYAHIAHNIYTWTNRQAHTLVHALGFTASIYVCCISAPHTADVLIGRKGVGQAGNDPYSV
jgi:hypothetical protein